MDVSQGAGGTKGDPHSRSPVQERLAQASEQVVAQASTAHMLIHQNLLLVAAAVALKLAYVRVIDAGNKVHLRSPVRQSLRLEQPSLVNLRISTRTGDKSFDTRRFTKSIFTTSVSCYYDISVTSIEM
jgi:hypothetical protein